MTRRRNVQHLTKDEEELPTSSKPHKKHHSKTGSNSVSLRVGICGLLILSISVLYYGYTLYLQGVVSTPLNVPKMNSDNSSNALVSPERFWGSYRPNLYFGLKTRSPTSPVVGLMWLPQLTNEMPPPIRHWCSQDDHLPKYGWLKHDGINFGIQEIEEKTYKLRTEFVKRMGGTHGGDWTSKISVEPKVAQRQSVVSLMFYIALDGKGNLQPTVNNNYLSSITGFSEELGHFKMSFPKSQSSGNVKYHHLVSYAGKLDRLKDLVSNSFRVDAWDKARTMAYFTLGGRLVPRDSPPPNFMVHQVTAQVPFQMEIVFESGSFVDRPNTLSGEIFNAELEKLTTNFDKKFSNVFNLKEKGFLETKIDFAKAAMSNMIGGIGYFYGSSIVQSKYNKEPVEYWPAALYTAVPSRSFFPRGFLWDEGFHNLLISQWDPKISEDIISHWLDLMNAEGWIPREQILGLEARARVPNEFIVQKNENANPPTLFLPLQRLIKQMIGSKNVDDHKFLKAVFPRLRMWFNWYNTSQVGSLPSSYRWRGRDAKTNKELNPKTLTSGLDDYPRASHPTDTERHVDLRCWMALASGIMADIAKELGEDHKEYAATHGLLTDNELLNKLHWSSKKQRYCDYGLHSTKVALDRPKPANPQPGQRVVLEKIRVVKKEPTIQYVESFGYVSLFPFLLKIVDKNSLNLFRILGDIKNTELLWTDYGLRSLAKTSPLYNRHNTEHDPPYWRGAIWINMNYLALSALHHYANSPGEYQQLAHKIYVDLRNNVINNIIKEYQRTGYIFEQYNDQTGEGKGSHPFTGWSALVVLIMAEKY